VNLSVLQWSSQHFNGFSVELGQFIQEQDAIVGQRDFSWLQSSVANQPCCADGVVWGTKRPYTSESTASGEYASHGVNPSDFNGFFGRQCWQDCWHSGRQHGFSAARRADHQQIVTSSGSDL